MQSKANSRLFLGVEIGGTKLQVGVGHGDGSPPIQLIRSEIDPSRGAAGILTELEKSIVVLRQKHSCEGIGVGFGGPIDASRGVIRKSHHVQGWDNFHFAHWLGTVCDLPLVLVNDCDSAAYAEAHHGAGEGHRSLFYITVGSGVGGGLVVNGELFGAARPAIAEVGHLRPGIHADRPDATVESIASGWGIAAETVARLTGEISPALEMLHRTTGPDDRAHLKQRLKEAADANREYTADLMARCNGDLAKLDARMIASAAAEGNETAKEVIDHSCQALGWAIGQVVTLIAPEVIAIGGGVSLIGENLFLSRVRDYARTYVFPPLTDSYIILPTALGELGVVHGALALARKNATLER